MNGGDTLTLVANDLGNFGSGGALSSNITRAITITAVNDRPVLNLPPPIQFNENSVLGLNLSGAVSGVGVQVNIHRVFRCRGACRHFIEVERRCFHGFP